MVAQTRKLPKLQHCIPDKNLLAETERSCNPSQRDSNSVCAMPCFHSNVAHRIATQQDVIGLGFVNNNCFRHTVCKSNTGPRRGSLTFAQYGLGHVPVCDCDYRSTITRACRVLMGNGQTRTKPFCVIRHGDWHDEMNLLQGS